MKVLKKGVNSVKGIYTLGKAIGIKKSGKKDLAIVYSKQKCNAAAVYTKNHVKGAPLYVTMEHLKDGKAQALIVNSGVANVCTGKKGIKDAKEMCKLAGKELCVEPKDVLVASTGLIGAYLPMDKIKKSLKGLKKGLNKKSKDAAKAILTTDSFTKEVTVKVGGVTISGMAKGAGMIHPNMATMLCFIFTDALFSSSQLNKMLHNAVDKSFNMISVDMDTSTSDMVTLMANGIAGKVNMGKFQKGLDLI